MNEQSSLKPFIFSFEIILTRRHMVLSYVSQSVSTEVL